MGFWSHVVEPGFLQSMAVRNALLAGGVVAAISGVVGVFTVLRGQSFAGHSLGDISATGGSGAFLVNVNPLVGYVTMGLVAAGCMEAIGVRRARGRDVATGIVLGAALGLSALFLYLDTTVHNTTGTAVTVLFGSLFTIPASQLPIVVICSAGLLVLLLAFYRPLLLSSVGDDIAAARGVPVRLIGGLFMATMAVSVALASLTIGAILSTALLIGPAATALRVTKRPGTAMAVASLVGVAATWLGSLLAYDSYSWPPAHHGWPVSFFIVALIFVIYLAVDLGRWWQLRHLVAGSSPAGTPEMTTSPCAQGAPAPSRHR